MFLVRILHTTAVIVLVWPEHHLYPNKRRGVLVYFLCYGKSPASYHFKWGIIICDTCR